MKLTYISPICEIIDAELDSNITAGSPIPPETNQNIDNDVTGGIGTATGGSETNPWVGLSKDNGSFDFDDGF